MDSQTPLIAYALAAVFAVVLIAFVAVILVGNLRSAVQRATTAWIFIDERGEPLFEGRAFIEVRPFAHGLAAVQTEAGWGAIDRTGAFVIPPSLGGLGSFGQEGLAPAQPPGKTQWGYVDQRGSFVIDPIFERAGSFVDGVAVVHRSIGVQTSQISNASLQTRTSVGVIRADGSYVVEPVMEADAPERLTSANPPREGRIGVSVQGRWGFIDLDGNPVIEPRWSNVRPFSQGRAAVMEEDGRWGFIDEAGEVVVKPAYRHKGSFAAGLAPVGTAEGVTFVGLDGASTGWTYDDAGPFGSDRAAIRVDGRWGFLDPTGRVAIEASFQEVVHPFDEGGRAVVSRRRSRVEQAYVRPSGEVSAWFDELKPFREGIGAARVDRPVR